MWINAGKRPGCCLRRIFDGWKGVEETTFFPLDSEGRGGQVERRSVDWGKKVDESAEKAGCF